MKGITVVRIYLISCEKTWFHTFQTIIQVGNVYAYCALQTQIKSRVSCMVLKRLC
jgi:hypothetical protein